MEKKGTHTCEKCGRRFEWNYFEKTRDKFEKQFYQAEEIPNQKLVYYFQEHNGGYEVRVNCPFCDFDNHFTCETH